MEESFKEASANRKPLEGSGARSRFERYLREVPEHGQTSDRVAEILREAILDGVLPPSYWLREKELANELSVSRTPIREALRRLSMEGLVVITAHQGAMVVPLTMEDILQVYAVRESLEGLASRLAAKNRTEEHIEQLTEALRKMKDAAQGDASELARLNLEFHKIVRQATKNQLLDRFLLQVEQAVRRFGSTTFEFPEWVEDSIEEHSQIIEAIKERDGEKAERLATEHMRHARRLRVHMLLGE